MIDLKWMQDHSFGASHGRWVDDLTELYCRTKAAQAQAEQHGFAGMAAALAEVAAGLAWEPGVDPAVVWALAGCEPTNRIGAPALHGSHGEHVTRHWSAHWPDPPAVRERVSARSQDHDRAAGQGHSRGAAIVAQRQRKTAPHPKVVATSTDVTTPGADGATTPSHPTMPVLAGLLLCSDGGYAVGVIGEVLAWDGQQLSLRITLDPGTTPGQSDVTIQVPLASCPGLTSGPPKAVQS